MCNQNYWESSHDVYNMSTDYTLSLNYMRSSMPVHTLCKIHIPNVRIGLKNNVRYHSAIVRFDHQKVRVAGYSKAGSL